MIKDLYGKQRAEYESQYSLSESVERLNKVVRSRWNLFPTRQGVYGYVSEERVLLYRVIPFIRNSFIPFFKGAFKYSGGKVILSGNYSMSNFTKIFMVVWFSGVLFGFFQIVIHGVRDLDSGKSLSDIDPMLLIPAGMILFGVLLVKSGKWFSRNDIKYISGVIEEALNKRS